MGETWTEYNGEKYLSSLGYDRTDKHKFKFVAIRPISEGRVKVMTIFPNDVITVTTKRVHKNLTKALFACREFGGTI